MDGLSVNELRDTELRGIVIPDDIMVERVELVKNLSFLEQQQDKFQKEAEEIPIAIEKARADLADAMIDGKPVDDLEKEIDKLEARLKNVNKAVETATERINAATVEVKASDQAIADFIQGERNRQHKQMITQLDNAFTERARNIDSRIPKSSLPTVEARSKIAVCEICRNEIALVREDATAPMSGMSFDKLPKLDPPFSPIADWQWMRCKTCGKRPWNEPDKVLVSDGFRILPSTKEVQPEQPAETAA